MLLEEIVKPGDEITYLKKTFVSELERYYADPALGDEQVKQAASMYSKALAARFGSARRAFRFDVMTTLGSSAAGAAVGGMGGGPIGAGVGLGLGLLGNLTSHTVGPKLLAKYSSPLARPWLTVTRSRMPAATSSLRLDRQKAARYLDGVERYQNG